MSLATQAEKDAAPTTLRRRVVTGARWSGAATAISGAVSLAQLVVLARLLGPTAIGIMAAATVLVEFGRVAGTMGLSEAVIQRKDPTREELSSLYWLSIVLATIAALLVALLAPVAVRIFGAVELLALLPVVALKLWILGFGLQFHALLRRELRFGLLATATVAGSLAGFAVAVSSAVLFDQGIWSLVWGVLATTIVHTAIFNWYGWRRKDRPYLHFSTADLPGYIRFGAFQSGASILNFVSARIDQVLIGALMGPRVLGLYTVAIELSRQPVQRILPVVSSVAFPALAAVQHDARRLRSGYLRMLRVLIFALFPMFIGLAAIAPVAVPLFFGPVWVEAVPLVQILAFAVLLSSFASVSRSLTSATGYVSWDFYWNAAAALLLPPVIYVAARTGDPIAVALALLGLHAVMSIVGYRLGLRRIVGSFMLSLLRTAWVPILVAVAMGVLVTAALQFMTPYPRTTQFVILAGVGGAFYFAATFLLNRELLMSHLGLVWERRPGARNVTPRGPAGQ